MHRQFIRYISLLIICLAGFAVRSEAQFKEEAFKQTYNADSTSKVDTVDKMFSFKDFAGGLAHKNKMKIGTMFIGSVVLPGTAQIYNKDYWKLPVIYGGIGAFAGTGGYYLHQYSKSKKAYDQWELDRLDFENTVGGTYTVPMPEVNMQAKKTGTWLMVGAGLMYWGSLMDGVVNYQADEHPHPGRATLYSLLLPGLGQIYNGELYKVPIYWGGLLVSEATVGRHRTFGAESWLYCHFGEYGGWCQNCLLRVIRRNKSLLGCTTRFAGSYICYR